MLFWLEAVEIKIKTVRLTVNLWQKASALKCMDSPKHEMAQEGCELRLSLHVLALN